MSENVRKQLQLNANLPQGSKRRSKRSRSSNKKQQEATPQKQEPEVIQTVPAEVIAEPFDIQQAQDVVFKPNDGPQTDFLASSEREVLYGGAAGGGKSFAMLADPLRGLNDNNFSGLLVRHTTEELRELIQKSQELFPKAIPGIAFGYNS